jgi:cation:H+ antiporter
MGSNILIFAVSLAVMSWASSRLTSSLERVGARWRFSEGLLGIVTALGADAPETCSAVTALLAGQHEIGVGVVLGSNIFNLAGLLGLSALVAGRVSIGRQGLWFNGGTGLLVTVVALALVLRWIPVGLSLAVLAVMLAPYVALCSLRSAQIQRLPAPAPWKRFLDVATGHIHRDARKREHIPAASWVDGVWIVVSLVLIIVSSAGMVHCAVALAGSWGISPAVVGMLVLAVLTSIPNAIAAVQLAREGRGAAVVSESLNSNTLNIVVGICLPALVLGFAAPSARIVFAALWLLGMKLVAVAAASHRHGLHRVGGAVLIGLYVVFAGVIVLWK